MCIGRGPDKQENGGVYCAFAPPTYRERALDDPGRDLMVTDGRPGSSQGPGKTASW